jgi:hypothetical protein
MISRPEMEQLRAWLEIDHGVDFPSLPFLYEVIDRIAADGEVTDEELDSLALAIERVLPAHVRAAVTKIRKERRADKLARLRQQKADKLACLRQQKAADRAIVTQARRLSRPMHYADFMVAGVRFEERRDACECLAAGDAVVFEREPDNCHDRNAILILDQQGSELGYVPRTEAVSMAAMLDAGARVEAVVKKLLRTQSGYSIPVVIAKLFPGDGTPSSVVATSRAAARGSATRTSTTPSPDGSVAAPPTGPTQQRTGCLTSPAALLLCVMLVGLALWL